ncbi:MAG: AAA family ATPase [Capsulimonadales bacterium]|nr:AAA family ATPase [Capsulimonadales bacterium]
MQIDQLTVRNFRCFDKKEVALRPGFNVLIGDNGSGKTAILEAIGVGLIPLIRRLAPDSPENNGHSSKTRDNNDVRIVTSGSPEQPTLEYAFPSAAGLLFTLMGHSFRMGQIQMSLKDIIVNDGELVDQVRIIVRQISTETPPVLPVIAYFTSRRRWQSAWDSRSPFDQEALEREVSGPTTRLDCYRTALAAETNERKVLQWLMRFDIAARQRNELNRTMEAAKQAMLSCLEGFHQLRFDAIEWNLLAENTSGNILPTRMLSDGQRNILSLVADIAFRCVTLNPELREEATKETPGVVLIDELDLHLHPKWQRRIVDDLRRTFPKIQFIVTTHSPLIIQSLRPGELIDLGPEVTDSPEEYVGKSPEDILENVMEVAMPQRSQRSQEMIAAAEQYYSLLRQASNHPDLPALRTELDRLMEPYEDNEAFIAALRLERAASGMDTMTTHNGHPAGQAP